MYEYDAGSDSWTEYVLPMDSNRKHGIEFKIPEKFYYGAGLDDGTPVLDFWEFNPIFN